jgi:hypothetical protein
MQSMRLKRRLIDPAFGHKTSLLRFLESNLSLQLSAGVFEARKAGIIECQFRPSNGVFPQRLAAIPTVNPMRSAIRWPQL